MAAFVLDGQYTKTNTTGRPRDQLYRTVAVVAGVSAILVPISAPVISTANLLLGDDDAGWTRVTVFSGPEPMGGILVGSIIQAKSGIAYRVVNRLFKVGTDPLDPTNASFGYLCAEQSVPFLLTWISRDRLRVLAQTSNPILGT
jgi:hypothetical protein